MAVLPTVDDRSTVSSSDARARVLQMIMNAVAADQIEGGLTGSDHVGVALARAKIIDVTPEPEEDDADGVAT